MRRVYVIWFDAGVVRLLLETCAEVLTILPTSSRHVSVGMIFRGLGIGGLSHQSCMSLHMGTNNIVGGSKSQDYIYGKLSRWVLKTKALFERWKKPNKNEL